MMASLLQMMGFGLPRSKADQAEVVPAPEEPVMAMIGCLMDM